MTDIGEGSDSGRTGFPLLAYATGSIHPTSGGWHLEEPIDLTFPDGRWQVTVRFSQFHVMLESPSVQDFATFSNEVVSIVQGFLDALGFHLATALRAELTSLVIGGSVLVIREPGWQALGGPSAHPLYVDGPTLQPFVKATGSNVFVRHALADLRAALEYPEDTAFYAYRALESIRQWFVGADADSGAARKRSWQELRDVLLVDQEALNKLRDRATPRRHGEATTLTEADRTEALVLARSVLNRFVTLVS